MLASFPSPRARISFALGRGRSEGIGWGEARGNATSCEGCRGFARTMLKGP